jgi:(2Fe-2S) ferredoxin
MLAHVFNRRTNKCACTNVSRCRKMMTWNPNDVASKHKASLSEDIYSTDKAERVASNLNLNAVGRHIFLCCDQSKAKCCTFAEGMEVWNHLKKRSREWNTNLPSVDDTRRYARTKANCLQVCKEGPIAVVYPDGVWYKGVTVSVLDQIIDQHLIGGHVVEEYVIENAGHAVQQKQLK